MPRLVDCRRAANSIFEWGDPVPYPTYDPTRKMLESDGPDNGAASENAGWYLLPSEVLCISRSNIEVK